VLEILPFSGVLVLTGDFIFPGYFSLFWGAGFLYLSRGFILRKMKWCVNQLGIYFEKKKGSAKYVGN
jgi:hypothetical protein